MKSANDWLTIAAVGVLAMCVVTFDHEGLGHGSACLLLHGHITLLSSSIFHCSARSGWIDPAGPVTNLLMGTLALIVARFVPPQRTAFKLFLICVTAFSYFWEAGYVMDAMRTRHGDLYFFAQFMLGDVPLWLRCVAAACGGAVCHRYSADVARALESLARPGGRARRCANGVDQRRHRCFFGSACLPRRRLGRSQGCGAGNRRLRISAAVHPARSPESGNGRNVFRHLAQLFHHRLGCRPVRNICGEFGSRCRGLTRRRRAGHIFRTDGHRP
jgi:hypothetical protein